MRKYEVRFTLKSKSLFGSMLNIHDTNTQIILADSERDLQKRLEAIYPDKNIRILSCKIVR